MDLLHQLVKHFKVAHLCAQYTKYLSEAKQGEIEQGKVRRLVIPSPGVINVVNNIDGYGSVYLLKEDGTQQWVHNFEGDKGRQNIALQPGRYKVVFRPKDALGSQYTKTKIVDLGEGESKGIDLLR